MADQYKVTVDGQGKSSIDSYLEYRRQVKTQKIFYLSILSRISLAYFQLKSLNFNIFDCFEFTIFMSIVKVDFLVLFLIQ